MPIDSSQVSQLQAQFDHQRALQTKFLMNPAFTGYSEKELQHALNMVGLGAPGSGPIQGTAGLPILGGVDLGALGLYGLPGGEATTSNLLAQGERVFNIGLQLGGPNSMAWQLDQKYKASLGVPYQTPTMQQAVQRAATPQIVGARSQQYRSSISVGDSSHYRVTPSLAQRFFPSQGYPPTRPSTLPFDFMSLVMMTLMIKFFQSYLQDAT